MTTRIDIEHLLDWAFRRESVETRRNPHGDALTVYWAVEALPEPYCSLVKRQARAGIAPKWQPDPGLSIVNLSELRQARARYGAWHKALGVLQQTLEGALQTFQVTGPAAPAAPWTINASDLSSRRQQAL